MRPKWAQLLGLQAESGYATRVTHAALGADESHAVTEAASFWMHVIIHVQKKHAPCPSNQVIDSFPCPTTYLRQQTDRSLAVSLILLLVVSKRNRFSFLCPWGKWVGSGRDGSRPQTSSTGREHDDLTTSPPAAPTTCRRALVALSHVP